MPLWDDLDTEYYLRNAVGKLAYQYTYDTGGRRLPKSDQNKLITQAVNSHANYV